MGAFDDLLPNCVQHAKAMGEIEKRLEEKIGEKKMDNEKITYEQVMEYCKTRNYALVNDEFLHIVLGGNPMELFGLPIEELKRVVEIYKYKGVVPTADYKEGFEDGVNYMKTYYEKVMDELVKNITR